MKRKMPQLQLNKEELQRISLVDSLHFSIYIEKGKAEVLFRMGNGVTHPELFITGEKKSWNKDELKPFVNFDLISVSDFSIIHYSLDKL